MLIQEQIHEWFNSSESLEEKAEVIRELLKVGEVLQSSLMQELQERKI